MDILLDPINKPANEFFILLKIQDGHRRSKICEALYFCGSYKLTGQLYTSYKIFYTVYHQFNIPQAETADIIILPVCIFRFQTHSTWTFFQTHSRWTILAQKLYYVTYFEWNCQCFKYHMKFIFNNKKSLCYIMLFIASGQDITYGTF